MIVWHVPLHGPVTGYWVLCLAVEYEHNRRHGRWYPRVVPKSIDFASNLKKRTLTNLYNQRPALLANAHRRLDEAVFAAYGWPPELPDDDLLARLLALNLERAVR